MSDLREYFRDRAAAAEAERDALRAELATERERAGKVEVWRGLHDGAVTVIKQLEAELAAERENVAQSERLRLQLSGEYKAVSDERDAMCEALRDLWHGHDLDAEFIARIGALLNEGGVDECNS